MHVVSAHWNESLDWLKQSEFKYTIVDKADNPNRDPDSTLHVEFNRGREASAYLKYIITHYNELPEHVAFIHGHETAWHQSRPMLQALRGVDTTREFQSLNNFTVLIPVPYATMRKRAQKHFPLFFDRSAWVEQLHRGWIIVADQGAQFCVHSKRIHRLPLAAWESLYEDIMLDPNDYWKGQTLEYIWHILMGENAAMWCSLKYININLASLPESPLIKNIPLKKELTSAVITLTRLKLLKFVTIIIVIFVLLLRHLLMNHNLLSFWNLAYGSVVPFAISFPEPIPTTPTLFVMTHDETNKSNNEDIAAVVDFVTHVQRMTGRKSSIIVHPKVYHEKFVPALLKLGARDITLLWQPSYRKHDAVRALNRGRNVVILLDANRGLERDNRFCKVGQKTTKPNSIAHIVRNTEANLYLIRSYFDGRIKNFAGHKHATLLHKALHRNDILHLSDADAEKLIRQSLFNIQTDAEQLMFEAHALKVRNDK